MAVAAIENVDRQATTKAVVTEVTEEVTTVDKATTKVVKEATAEVVQTINTAAAVVAEVVTTAEETEVISRRNPTMINLGPSRPPRRL